MGTLIGKTSYSERIFCFENKTKTRFIRESIRAIHRSTPLAIYSAYMLRDIFILVHLFFSSRLSFDANILLRSSLEWNS